MDAETTITIEGLKELMKEVAKSQAENAQQFKGVKEQFQEVKEQFQEVKERLMETDHILSEKFSAIALQSEKTDRRLDRLSKLYGGLSSNYGSFAEEYFFNSFDDGKQNFFGENFDIIERNYTDNRTGEYDILMINGKAVAIIETKFKARESSVSDTLKKAVQFRKNFPKYKSHKLYLGLAAMVFEPLIEQACKNEGIAVIKQVGDTVVINDDQLKTF